MQLPHHRSIIDHPPGPPSNLGRRSFHTGYTEKPVIAGTRQLVDGGSTDLVRNLKRWISGDRWT